MEVLEAKVNRTPFQQEMIMNIKKYMKVHESYIKEQLLLKADKQHWDTLKEKHERMTKDMQHERLIHLIVTFAFGVLLLITTAIVLITPSLQVFILMGFFFIMLVPYIIHYFFLENTIQRWYKLMDDIERK